MEWNLLTWWKSYTVSKSLSIPIITARRNSAGTCVSPGCLWNAFVFLLNKTKQGSEWVSTCGTEGQPWDIRETTEGTSLSLKQGSNHTACFCVACELRIVLTFLIIEQNSENIVICHGMWKLYEMQISMTIDKILLKHSPAYWFIVICGCFPAAMAELSWNRDHLKASHMYCWALQRRVWWPLNRWSAIGQKFKRWYGNERTLKGIL